MTMKKAGFILILFFPFLPAEAQQIGMYGHAFFKPMVYNPAYAGNSESTNAMILSRSQWTSFKNAPQLNLFTLDGNLQNKKVGLGLSLISDRKGITNRTGGNLEYSYRVTINDDMYLRFGVAAGIIDQTIDYSKALVENGSDPILFSYAQRKTTFDADAGVAFFWKGLEAGAAVPQLAGNKISFVDNTGVRARYIQVRHYLGTLKYNFILSKDKGISIAPQALVRYVPNAPLQYDGTLSLDWKDKMWIGASYKSDYAITAFAGVCIHKQLYIGYAYDIILGNISKYAGTSHEIMVNFKFGKNKKEEQPSPANVQSSNAGNEAYQTRLDSLQSVIRDEQAQITENKKKLEELNNKLEQRQAATPASPSTGTEAAVLKNENQNAAAVETNADKAFENGTWLVTNSAAGFKDANDHPAQKGFYVVAGTFVYRDFAEAEVKRLSANGFSKTSLLFSAAKQYNYVFISTSPVKEDALKKAGEARKSGIKDAWVLQLAE
jgi:type IX secretion system PorP/SprF family membrane protein